MKSKAADRLKRLAENYAREFAVHDPDDPESRAALGAARKALHDAIDLTVSLKEPLELDDL